MNVSFHPLQFYAELFGFFFSLPDSDVTVVARRLLTSDSQGTSLAVGI